MEEDKETSDVAAIFRGICRACIKKNKELFPLFGGAKIKFGDKCFTISEILFLGGRVKTSSVDKLPKHVCRKCLTRLIEIFSFQLKCIETDIKLKNILSKQMILAKTEQNILVQTSLNKEKEIGKETYIKSEKLDLSQNGFPEIELEKSITETVERENDNTNNNKGSISDIVVSILEDRDQQVSVSMTVTLNDKNQSRQSQESRAIQEMRSIQDKEDYMSAKDNNINLTNQLSNEINETDLKNNTQQINSEPAKGQGKFICTFCKNSFDTWSDLGKHIVKHKIQNNYGRLKSESPTLEIASEINSKDKIICEKCAEEFYSQENYDVHMKTSHNQNTSGNYNQLENGMEDGITLNILSEQEMPILTPISHTSFEERFYCEFCPANYKYKSDLKKHTRKKHREKPSKESYSCPKCHKKFQHYLQMVRHRRRYHSKTSKNRDKLPVVLTTNNITAQNVTSKYDIIQTVKTHRKKLLSDKSETVKTGQGENPISQLTNAEESPSKELIQGRFYCVDCPSHYARRTDLVAHVKVKHNKKLGNIENNINITYSQWKCEICTSIYGSKKSLQAHFRKKHEIPLKEKTSERSQCKICSRTFINDRTLDIHVFSTHRTPSSKPIEKLNKETGTATYKCTLCNGIFSSLFGWKSHTFSKHTKANKNISFKCHICGKAFLREFSLKSHLKLHKSKSSIEERSITRKLSTSTDLESELTHNTSTSSIKPSNDFADDVNEIHKCLHCPSMFHNRGNLRKHSKILHGDKVREYDHEKTDSHLFQCLACCKWYISSSYLKLHYKKHVVKNGATKFKCDICQDNFDNIKKYSHHLSCHRAEARKCNRYCKECVTIFPNEKGYKLHMFNKHKILINL